MSREEFVLAVRDEESLDAFAAQHRLSRADAERAVGQALARAIDEAEDAGALSGFTASVLRRAVVALPPWLVLEALENVRGLLP